MSRYSQTYEQQMEARFARLEDNVARSVARLSTNATNSKAVKLIDAGGPVLLALSETACVVAGGGLVGYGLGIAGWQEALAPCIASGFVVGGLALAIRCVVDLTNGLQYHYHKHIHDGEPVVIERPVFTQSADKTKLRREPVATRDVTREMCFNHPGDMATVCVEKRKVRTFLIASVSTGDWTRERWVKEGGLKKRQWEAVRAYLQRAGVWQTTDRPALLVWMNDNGFVTDADGPDDGRTDGR